MPEATCSLPHRQLRNEKLDILDWWEGSLPHRQLRNLKDVIVTPPLRSLPHRQLRKIKLPSEPSS